MDGDLMRYKKSGYWNRDEGRGRKKVYVPKSTFQYTVETSTANETYYTSHWVDGSDNASAKMIIDWGDGNTETIEPGAGVGITPEHVYATAGEHQITIEQSDYVSYDFTSDGNLKSIDTQFPESFIAPSYGLLEPAGLFDGCSNLVSVPSKMLEHVMTKVEPMGPGRINVSYMFQDCTSLTTVPDDFLWFDMDELIAYNGGDYDDLWAWSFFYGCSSLADTPELLIDHIRLSSNGDMLLSAFFELCTSLTDAKKQKLDYSTYTVDFRYMYQDCTSLVNIQSELLANTGASNDEFDDVFRGCTALTTIPSDLFNGNTNITATDDMFDNCTGLTAYPTGLFDGCTGLNTPGSLTRTFDGCTGMTNACDDLWNDFPLAGANSTFRDCTNLSNNASIPTGWK